MKISLNIEDSKVATFLNFIQTVDYIQVETNIEQTEDWYDELTPEQIKDIEQGLDDLKNGRTYTSEEVRKRIKAKIESKKTV